MIKSLQKRNQDQNRELKKMALPSFVGKYLQSNIAKQPQD